MKMRLVLSVAFLIAMTVGVADAEWDWSEAEPQQFDAPEGKDYVIAVGTTDVLVSVQANDIEEALADGKEIRLGYAKVEGNISFSGEIKRDVCFTNSALEHAYFGFAIFTGKAYFRSAQFTGNVNFRSATFTGYAVFRDATFEKSSDFRGCVYSEKSMVYFTDVTGFSNMKMEWDNSEDGRGLKGRLKYDETFYIALIKNYREMGWLGQADDSYYTYQVEKRERVNRYGETVNSWYRRAFEYVMLDVSFGYGVKPMRFLRSFLILFFVV